LTNPKNNLQCHYFLKNLKMRRRRRIRYRVGTPAPGQEESWPTGLRQSVDRILLGQISASNLDDLNLIWQHGHHLDEPRWGSLIRSISNPNHDAIKRALQARLERGLSTDAPSSDSPPFKALWSSPPREGNGNATFFMHTIAFVEGLSAEEIDVLTTWFSNILLKVPASPEVHNFVRSISDRLPDQMVERHLKSDNNYLEKALSPVQEALAPVHKSVRRDVAATLDSFSIGLRELLDFISTALSSAVGAISGPQAKQIETSAPSLEDLAHDLCELLGETLPAETIDDAYAGRTKFFNPNKALSQTPDYAARAEDAHPRIRESVLTLASALRAGRPTQLGEAVVHLYIDRNWLSENQEAREAITNIVNSKLLLQRRLDDATSQKAIQLLRALHSGLSPR
jgi:hypothetical protein